MSDEEEMTEREKAIAEAMDVSKHPARIKKERTWQRLEAMAAYIEGVDISIEDTGDPRNNVNPGYTPPPRSV